MPIADFRGVQKVQLGGTDAIKRVCLGAENVWPSTIASGRGWYLQWVDPGKETLDVTLYFWYDASIYPKESQIYMSWGTSFSAGPGIPNSPRSYTTDAPNPGPAWAEIRAGGRNGPVIGRVNFTVQYTQQVAPYHITESQFIAYARDSLVDWGANGVAMPEIEVLAGRDFTIDGSPMLINEAGFLYQNMWISAGDTRAIWGTIVDNGNLSGYNTLQSRYGGRINHPSNVKAGDHAFLCVGDNPATSGDGLIKIKFI